MLVLSLVEVLLILPAHLSSGDGWEPRFYSKIRTGLANGMDRFVNGPYRWLLTRAVRWRYATLATGLGIFMVAIGLVRGGHLPWVFFPAVEADIITANVELPPGTSVNRTSAVIDRIASAAEELKQELAAERGEDAPTLIRHIQRSVGGTPYADIAGGPGGRAAIASRDPRIGEVIIELAKAEERDTSAVLITDRWREKVGEIPGIRSLEFRSDLLRAGDPVNVELRSRDIDGLKEASAWLKSELGSDRRRARYQGHEPGWQAGGSDHRTHPTGRGAGAQGSRHFSAGPRRVLW